MQQRIETPQFACLIILKRHGLMKPLCSSANKDKRQGQVRAKHTMQGQAKQIVGIRPGLETFATSTSVW